MTGVVIAALGLAVVILLVLVFVYETDLQNHSMTLEQQRRELQWLREELHRERTKPPLVFIRPPPLRRVK